VKNRGEGKRMASSSDEWFLAIFPIGKDNEVCFPSYKNKKKTQVEKQYKGIAG
jgi:hypothetical protein